jgi:DNA-binding LacI/PurR family transcriptional regulator
MTNRPTLQTIADAVGVSRTTVSNAYNRPGELTDALREEILATAARLGYAGPDPAARRLRTGKSQTIGVVFTNSVTSALFDPTAVVLMRGIAAACETTALALTLLPGAADTAALIRNAAVDGFIVYSVSGDGVAPVLERKLPTVVVDEPRIGEAAVGYVGVDDTAGARAAAEHVLALGHRRITVLAGPLGDGHTGFVPPDGVFPASRVVRDRLEGYRSACEAHGVPWSEVRLFAAAGQTPSDARGAASSVLAAKDPCTAVLAMTDQLALAVLNEAAHRSIDVPRQLSVVGFDDVPRASVASPSLTTVRQPLFEKGRLALRMLRDEALGVVVLPTELVVRDSTAPAPST